MAAKLALQPLPGFLSNGNAMKNKCVLVAGGTAGIGLVAAKLLARQGASLALMGRTESRWETAKAELAEFEGRCFFVKGNSGDYADAERCAAEASQKLGRIDAIVSAGAENPHGLKPFAEMSVEHMRGTIDSLLYPRIFPVRAAIPYLKKAGGGAIVMVTSDAGRHATPGESMVGAAAASVILLTKALAKELARDKIRVNSVAMTITSETPGWDRAFATEMGSKVFGKAVERFPFGRPPNSVEVANAIEFLVGERSSQISGQTVSVNGGLSFGGW